jgi:putative endonuclease
MNQYYVYMNTNPTYTVLYVGMTNNLEHRTSQHRNHVLEGFTKKYNVTRLVYFEATEDVQAAIAREKQLERWTRARKIALIESANPEWRDLSDGLLRLPRPRVNPTQDSFAKMGWSPHERGRRSE